MTTRERKQQIALTILKVIGVAGIISVALVAPNSLRALKLFNLGGRKLSDKKYYINSTIGKLKSKGLIRFVNKNNKKYFELTKRGKAELIQKQTSSIKIKKPKKWDRKWHVVIFDIKENRRQYRDKLRSSIEALGFKKIQNSVWVYPYKCEELIFLLKTDYSLGKNVLYMEVSSLENDGWLKRTFNLIS